MGKKIDEAEVDDDDDDDDEEGDDGPPAKARRYDDLEVDDAAGNTTWQLANVDAIVVGR